MKILLVDDDEAVLQGLVRVLQTFPQYNVSFATSGTQAMESAMTSGAPDLLITDVIMEPMNGLTLCNKMSNRFAHLKTIFITGYDLGEYHEYTQGHPVLIKPVTAKELLRAIESVIEQAPVAPEIVEKKQATPEPVAPEKPSESAPPAAASPVAPAPVPAPEVPKASPFSLPPPRVPQSPRPNFNPRTTPAAPPRIVSSQTPEAKPRPRPTAVPQVVPGPKPAAIPPQAKPVATPPAAAPPVHKTPAPTAVPQAAPAPVPQAAPVPTPVATPQAAVPPADTGSPAEAVAGGMIGAYKLVRELGTGKWGRVFEAVQISMSRTVAMELLSPELQSDPASKAQFMANASAKANVQHPQILSVYEAGESDGHCYFTREYVDGQNFANLVASGQTIDEPVALKTVKVIAEALAYLNQKKITHSPLEATGIYLGSDNRPRLANLATHEESQPEVQDEIRMIGQAVSAALPGGRATSPGLAGMFIRMKTGGQNGFQSWASLLQVVTALEPKVVPADAFKLSAQDEAAIRAVGAARKKQKRQLIASVVGAVVLVCVSGVVLWRIFGTNEKNLDVMVKIPAGEFLYQDGKKETLPTFWIDQYEVTIGQYSRFLDYLTAHPDEKTKFDHPDQPKGKSHKPLNWDIYLGRAKWAKPVKFIPINLNCPQFLVDWWDAYAYAKWKGRRLPTEQEWEKAARGTDGRSYPWGSEFDPKKCNSNLDYIERPGPDSVGRVDGFFAWCPVDAIPYDKSPYGVVGMAGNVSEWTGTIVETPDGKVPVVRGGNYHSVGNEVTRRITNFDHEATNEYLGFRTASEDEPK